MKRSSRCLVLITGLLGTPLCALAAYSPDDAFTAYAEEAWRSDSNVFNVGDGKSVNGEDPHKSSQVFDTRAFVHYHYMLSRQRLYGESTLSRTNYTRFSAVNYSGWHNTAGWDWVVGDGLEGVIAYTDSRNLAEFNNLAQGQGDLLRDKTLRSTTQYTFNPNLQLFATTSHQIDRHNQLDYLDLNASSQGGGLIGSLSKGGALTLRFDRTRVDFLQDFRNLAAVERGYDQRTTQLSAEYPVGPTLTISGNASRVKVKQKSDNTTVQNTLSGGEVRWQATSRLRMTANYQRKYDAPGSDTSATLSSNHIGRLEWQHSAKLRFAAQRYVSKTSYGEFSQGGEREERTVSDRAEIGWVPRSSIAVTVYGQHVAHSSPVPANEFQQNQLGASVRVNY